MRGDVSLALVAPSSCDVAVSSRRASAAGARFRTRHRSTHELRPASHRGTLAEAGSALRLRRHLPASCWDGFPPSARDTWLGREAVILAASTHGAVCQTQCRALGGTEKELSLLPGLEQEDPVRAAGSGHAAPGIADPDGGSGRFSPLPGGSWSFRHPWALPVPGLSQRPRLPRAWVEAPVGDPRAHQSPGRSARARSAGTRLPGPRPHFRLPVRARGPGSREPPSPLAAGLVSTVLCQGSRSGVLTPDPRPPPPVLLTPAVARGPRNTAGAREGSPQCFRGAREASATTPGGRTRSAPRLCAAGAGGRRKGRHTSAQRWTRGGGACGAATGSTRFAHPPGPASSVRAAVS
ncbi:GAS2-like protein 1 [Lutra lutra]|uniref:GAS2-like protein 1 n=1 Tax=Lutra lutra TaxID=9657 RepID=UPI001FD17E68|nr:GAS2-like protein 1 [Lutra lutra]